MSRRSPPNTVMHNILTKYRSQQLFLIKIKILSLQYILFFETAPPPLTTGKFFIPGSIQRVLAINAPIPR